MNNRQFAAAHDRLLEPPDDDDGEENWEEMDLAALEHQRCIDHEDWLAEQYRQKQEDQS